MQYKAKAKGHKIEKKFPARALNPVLEIIKGTLPMGKKAEQYELFDNVRRRVYRYNQKRETLKRGGIRVKRRLGTLVLLLLTSVLCVSAIPQPDQPETSYNEVDTPVNQAPAVVPGVKFERPSIVPVQLPKAICQAAHYATATAPNSVFSDLPVHRDPPSFHSLLCTFLI